MHPDGHEREQLHRQDPEEPTHPVESEAQQDQVKSQVSPRSVLKDQGPFLEAQKIRCMCLGSYDTMRLN